MNDDCLLKPKDEIRHDIVWFLLHDRANDDVISLTKQTKAQNILREYLISVNFP